MTVLKIGSLNCRGLYSDPLKRRDVFLRCREKYDICILVDTHSTKQIENAWKSEWGYTAIFSSNNSSSRGVAILFKNSFTFCIEKCKIDENGNYIIIDLKTQEQQLTLAAVYGPNQDSPAFYINLFNNIEQFENSSIIIGGDWNITQDYDIDNFNYKHKNNPNAQKNIKKLYERV